ncbi:MBL fold metallo-hydrolase [Deminuibacter soli]|uniref:MBL fold metallo-hydrolase n=1 Tax=Deminuibacter soli TaxID=2291815 RepID=A0A3E1NLX3_9BACT|nr:MBL fold metallo-hydrolase [Deminuibacter soli]RFM28798.1 MBL fold metallo-hydrolase [Deminuibacter soli]
MQPAQIRLLRHATLLIEFNGLRLLVDPLLADKETLDPVQPAANKLRNPRAPLAIDEAGLQQLIQQVDAVLVTHIHPDHWDVTAQNLLPKDIVLFCQPADIASIKAQGFTNVLAIQDTHSWKGIQLHRTGGHHGTGEIEKKMGIVSGFVLDNGSQRIYIAGDTIWCNEVKSALFTYHPTATIVNAGAAQFLQGGPITMTPDDVISVYKTLPSTKLIAVHMDAINHCLVSRANLKEALVKAGIDGHVLIPEDGETITL